MTDAKVMRVGLLQTKNLNVADLGLDLHNLTNARVYGVTSCHRINAGVSEYIVAEYSNDELSSPDSDPLVIGLVLHNGEYVPHAVWDDKVWSILGEDTLDILSTMLGVSVENLQTAEAIIESQTTRRQSDDPSGLPDSPGRPEENHN
jgi:hypothetical protein